MGEDFVYVAGDDGRFAVEHGVVAGLGDLLGCFGHAFGEGGTAEICRVSETCFGVAGAEGGGGDAGSLKLFGDRLGEGEDVGFGREVDGLERPGHERGGGGDI